MISHEGHTDRRGLEEGEKRKRSTAKRARAIEFKKKGKKKEPELPKKKKTTIPLSPTGSSNIRSEWTG